MLEIRGCLYFRENPDVHTNALHWRQSARHRRHREMTWPELFVFVGLAPDGEIFFYVRVVLLKFGEKSLVGEIQ